MHRPVLCRVSALVALAAALFLAQDRTAVWLDVPHGQADRPAGAVRVIVETNEPATVEQVVRALGGQPYRRLTSVPAVAAELPQRQLEALAHSPGVRAVHPDRPIRGALHRTAAAIGARWVAENLGVDGAGIGVAIIDSGAAAHDDVAGKVVHFADFVTFQLEPHDGYGHGTHVAGIIAGTGQSSDGARRGVAPGSHLIVLKALDALGDGHISNAIAALDYAIEQKSAFNIRVINLSVAAGVYESYKTDPFTLAAGRAVEAGIVVVTAAGNLGRSPNGRPQYGGITAPGNAPWVLTVGASTHNGTVEGEDDTVAPFSSMGPSAIDFVAKPDLVAPGVGIEAAADPASTLFIARPNARVWGTGATAAAPYLSLSGTSMAAPVVAATAALMLQANPALTPAAVKAILQNTAEHHARESQLAQGAGFLNARRAVELARTFAEDPASTQLLDDFVAVYQPDEGIGTTRCTGDGDAACRSLAATCAVTLACFDHLAGAVVGVVSPAADQALTASRPSAVQRRRRRVRRPKPEDDRRGPA